MDRLLAMRAFVRVAEAGSFVKAAGSMNLPRSTTSKLVQDLERELAIELVHRTTRVVSVTAAGAAYYERAIRVLAEVDDMDAEVADAQARLTGRLRVDIGSSLANLVLLPALPAFRALYPELEIVVGVSDRSIDLVADGVDCVVRGGTLADTSLIARRIAELDYVTCASPAYLREHGTPRKPGDLASGHAILAYFSASTGTTFALQFHRGAASETIDARGSVGVSESTAHMTGLVAGLGIGQTFRFAAQPYLDDGRLVRVLPAWTRPRHPLQLLYPAARHLSAKLRVFSDWTAATFAAIDDR